MLSLSKTFGKIVDRIKGVEQPREDSLAVAASSKVYLKALPLRSLDDVNAVKREVESGNILILRVSPLARRSIEDVKKAVNELYEFTKIVGGDIARLGEERVVITPSFVRIWRESGPSILLKAG